MRGTYQPPPSDSRVEPQPLWELDTLPNPTRSESRTGSPESIDTRGVGPHFSKTTISAGPQRCACCRPDPYPPDLSGPVSIQLLTNPRNNPFPNPSDGDHDNPSWSDVSDCEIDLAPHAGQRFDEPTDEEFRQAFHPPPIKLERRGASSHREKSGSRSTHTPWQEEFWQKQSVFKSSVAAKLRAIGQDALAMTLEA